MIRFPSSTSKSDKVLLRGSAEDIEKAKERLMELTHEKVQYLIGHSFTLTKVDSIAFEAVRFIHMLLSNSIAFFNAWLTMISCCTFGFLIYEAAQYLELF